MGRAPQESHMAGPDHSYYPVKRTELGHQIIYCRKQMDQVKDHEAEKGLVKNQQHVNQVLDMYHPAEALLAGSEKPENCLRDSYG